TRCPFLLKYPLIDQNPTCWGDFSPVNITSGTKRRQRGTVGEKNAAGVRPGPTPGASPSVASKPWLHLFAGAVLETAEKESAVAALSLHSASASRSPEDPRPSHSPAEEGRCCARCSSAKFGLCEQPSPAGAEVAGKGHVPHRQHRRSEEISWMWSVISHSHLCALRFVEKMFGRLTLPQLLFASILGIAGGIYIYQPIFEQYSRDQKELKEKLKLAQESEEKKS
uniref:PIGB opposite strand 1 n=2 Tax=Equus asinus TaxID=9793 RepID=A0A9L0IXW0_EQUAS